MKKALLILLALALVLTFAAGCAQEPADNPDDPNTDANTERVTLTVGASPTPHAEILAATKDILAEQGIDLVIKEFNDYVIPNTSVEDGSIDANYFQHQAYLDQFNIDNGTHLVSVASIHYEPYAIYPSKTTSLEDVQDGATSPYLMTVPMKAALYCYCKTWVGLPLPMVLAILPLFSILLIILRTCKLRKWKQLRLSLLCQM